MAIAAPVGDRFRFGRARAIERLPVVFFLLCFTLLRRPYLPALARIADHPINLAGDLLRRMNGARRRASASSTAQAAQRGVCFLHPTRRGTRIEKTMLRDLGACAFSHDLGAKPEAADPEQSFRSAPIPAIQLATIKPLDSTPAPSFAISPADGRVWPRSGHSHRIIGQAQRVEIISAKEPRRRWSHEEKRRLGTDVLDRINGPPASRLDELLPWNWKGRSARLVA